MYTGNLGPVSNAATWSESVELTDDEDGDEIDLSAVDEITIEVREQGCTTATLSGTLTGGEITRPGGGTDGVFQWEFTADAMGALDPKTYDVVVRIEEDDQTVQLLIGTVPVLQG